MFFLLSRSLLRKRENIFDRVVYPESAPLPLCDISVTSLFFSLLAQSDQSRHCAFSG